MSLRSGRQGRRGPSLRGSVMIDTYRGVIRARAWPRKRPQKLPPEVQANIDWFAGANRVLRGVPARLQVIARNVTEGTPLMPRDLQVAAMKGRLWTIKRPDGRTIYPMAGRQDVSESLNFLGQNIGDVLARGDEFWEAVPIGQAGQVLTANGPGQTPTWQTPGGGGGSRNLSTVSHSGTTGAAFASRGFVFTPLQQLTISACMVAFDANAAGSYRCSIVQLADYNIINVLAQSPAISGFPTAFVNRWFALDNDAVVNAGTSYAAVHTRTDGAPTTANGTRFDQASLAPAPVQEGYAFGNLASVNPMAGQSFATIGSANPYAVNIAYAF